MKMKGRRKEKRGEKIKKKGRKGEKREEKVKKWKKRGSKGKKGGKEKKGKKGLKLWFRKTVEKNGLKSWRGGNDFLTKYIPLLSSKS